MQIFWSWIEKILKTRNDIEEWPKRPEEIQKVIMSSMKPGEPEGEGLIDMVNRMSLRGQ